MFAVRITGIYTPILTDIGYIFLSYLRPGIHLIGLDPETKTYIKSPVAAIRRKLTTTDRLLNVDFLRLQYHVTDDDYGVDPSGTLVKLQDLPTSELHFGFPLDLYDDQHVPNLLEASYFGLAKWNPETRRVKGIYSDVCTASRRILKGFFRIRVKDVCRAYGTKRIRIKLHSFLEFLNFLELFIRYADLKTFLLRVLTDLHYVEFVLRPEADAEEWRTPHRFSTTLTLETTKPIITLSNIIITERPIICVTSGLMRG